LPVGGGASIPKLLGPWQAKPFRVSDAAVFALDAACRAYHQMAPSVGLAVVDARGGGRIILQYAGRDGHEGYCLATVQPDGRSVSEIMSASTYPQAIDVVPLRKRELRSHGGGGSPSSAAPDDRWVSETGQAGPGIDQVVAVVPGLREAVVASMGDGWWVLWFPIVGSDDYRIIGLNRAGEQVAELRWR